MSEIKVEKTGESCFISMDNTKMSEAASKDIQKIMEESSEATTCQQNYISIDELLLHETDLMYPADNDKEHNDEYALLTNPTLKAYLEEELFLPLSECSYPNIDFNQIEEELLLLSDDDDSSNGNEVVDELEDLLLQSEDDSQDNILFQQSNSTISFRSRNSCVASKNIKLIEKELLFQSATNSTENGIINDCNIMKEDYEQGMYFQLLSVYSISFVMFP